MKITLCAALIISQLIHVQLVDDALTTERRVEFVRDELKRSPDCVLIDGSIDLARPPVTDVSQPVGARTLSRVTYVCEAKRGPVRGEGFVAQVDGRLVLSRTFNPEARPDDKITTERKLAFVRSNFAGLVEDCALVPGSIDLTRLSTDEEIYVTTRVRFRCTRGGRGYRGEARLEADGRKSLNWVVDMTQKSPGTVGFSLVPMN